MCKLLGLHSDSVFYDNLLEQITDRVGSQTRTDALVTLGLFSEEKVEKLGSPLDTISNHLASMMAYDPDERDMVLMRNEVCQKNRDFLDKYEYIIVTKRKWSAALLHITRIALLIADMQGLA